ncbi:hypothetical protein HYPDE_24048 [Hyphomicrobium denitrificans 1NES1]|uniref:Cytochrome c domain-containing protein n=1 Tax=Hyphomicrobium denitrificans 1NES1 TaxID=670307 RepID=N0B8Y4_9HYPH|nr:di-heme oxidoredictase family protein [Hyphomicrobium denitrificans]AGK56495.1 hypothetical protein HYPDE_24048 [Hyphomicrobium denitrificans 1NES1]
MTSGLRLWLRVALLIFVIFMPRVADADPLDAAMGKALFDRTWVPAPASTDASDGLGPLFVSRSCTGCHGRGEGSHVVTREDGSPDIAGAVVRFGRADGSTDPFYGLELQTNAVPGLMPEGSAQYLPKLELNLNDRALANDVKAGVRLAPSLFGRAAFDSVPDAEILKRFDPDDRDGDGVRGRANKTAGGIGRYGWKAAQVTLEEQVAHAFAFDIGLSSPKQPRPYGDCTILQTACLAAPNGESPLFKGRELSGDILRVVAVYLGTLRARHETTDPEAAALFAATGCATCHVPSLATRDGGSIPAFTDLLLHDMGSALDDGVGEPGVKPEEWRTAPLIDGHVREKERRFLHDGSAASVSEAVAKHGGEGARSRDLFEALKPEDKQRLVDYVSGL